MLLDELALGLRDYLINGGDPSSLIREADCFSGLSLSDKLFFINSVGFNFNGVHVGPVRTIVENVIFYHDVLGLDFNDINRLINVLPHIITYSNSNLSSKVDFYESVLGIAPNEFGSIVKRFPSILGFSVVDGSSSNIHSKINFYKEILGINPRELGGIVKKSPTILGLSVVDDGSESNLRSKINFYKERLGINPRELGSIVKRYPTILNLSVVDDGSESNLHSKINFFENVLGITLMELGGIVKKFPSILAYSVVDDGSESNLRSKIDFYLNDYGFSKSEFIDLIKRTPSILGSSIKSNVEPRVYFLRLKGLINNYKITSVTLRSNKRFALMCGVSVSEYESFRDNWVYLTSQKRLGLDKRLLDYTQLTHYSKNQLETAYEQIINEGLTNELTSNPNLIFSYASRV